MEGKVSKIGLTLALSLVLAVALAITGATAPRAEAQPDPDTDPPPLANLHGQYKPIGVFLTWTGLNIASGDILFGHRSHVSGPCPCEDTEVTILVDVNSGRPVAALDKQPTSGATYHYWLTYKSNRSSYDPKNATVSKTLSYFVSPKLHSLQATATHGSGVILDWTIGASPKYTKQIVRRRAAGSSDWTETEIGVHQDTYTDPTAASGVKYIYRIKAEKANGKGKQTNRVKVTVP